MRRSRRGGHHSGMEFGGTGEDSFVAVVVTKLTGALLFILLLTMVIMALLPKAVDLPGSRPTPTADAEIPPLAISTPGELPEAIAGRPYTLALAATGGRGPLRWAVDGVLPEGLKVDADTGQIHGTPARGTPEPSKLNVRVSDGLDRTSRATQLVVYQPDRPLTMPSRWKPTLPPIPWREWIEQGFGFLVLALVHLVGVNTLNALERRGAIAIESTDDADETPATTTALLTSAHRRFTAYRVALRLATCFAVVGLGVWLARFRG